MKKRMPEGNYVHDYDFLLWDFVDLRLSYFFVDCLTDDWCILTLHIWLEMELFRGGIVIRHCSRVFSFLSSHIIAIIILLAFCLRIRVWDRDEPKQKN